MAGQPVGERGRLLRAMGLTWIIAPKPPAPTTPPARAAQPSTPRRPERPTPEAPPRTTPPAPPTAAARPPLMGVLRALVHGKKQPLHTLWTYAELWEDLHAPRPPRLELIKKIQAACAERLGWETARMALWPCRCPTPETWEHGLAQWQPRCLLVFGQAAIRHILPEIQAPSTPFPWGDMLVAPLPDLDAMLAGDTQAKASAWQMLQRLPALPARST